MNYSIDTKLSELERQMCEKDYWGSRLNIIWHFCKLAPDPCNVLEIGVKYGDVPLHTLDLIWQRRGHYVGVDVTLDHVKSLDWLQVHPNCTFFQMTSEDFWNAHIGGKYDLIYVDGAHDLVTSAMDITHAMSRVSPWGYILIHDIANEKFPEDGPRNAFFRECVPNRHFTSMLLYHEQGWMGVVRRIG